jgi:hypothetical protein
VDSRELDAFSARFSEHRDAGRDACCAALAASSPDLALETLHCAARAGDETGARALAKALAGTRSGARAASCAAALRAAPARHRTACQKLAAAEGARALQDTHGARGLATEASETLIELGDQLGAALADRLLLALYPGLEHASSLACRDSDEGRLTLVAAGNAAARGDGTSATVLWRTVARFCEQTPDAGLAFEAEQLRPRAAPGLASEELGAWATCVAKRALERRRPLLALRCALEAESGESSLLVARAELALGQTAAALEQALSVVALARRPRARGKRGRGRGRGAPSSRPHR